MLVLCHLEYRVTAVEIMPLHEPGSLELGQYAIDSCQTDVIASIDQCPIDIFGAQMPIARAIEDLEDAEPREGGFEPGFLEFLRVHGSCQRCLPSVRCRIASSRQQEPMC